MRYFVSLVYSLTISGSFVGGTSIPLYFERSPTTRPNLDSTQVQKELGTLVSEAAVIFGPSDSRYSEATARWNTFAVPQIQVVIEPGQESDVSIIVKYCNENSIEFLAINRGHGSPVSLGTFRGVQINLANLRDILIRPSGKSAWFGGGVFVAQVSEYLWDHGYVTTTGSCDCVGIMGAGLGGGHGRHEGLYGMISDNILQFNIVLGDGSKIRVNGSNHHDLFWAMKGAGHNFGIVTSFEMNIYPRGPDTWHYHNYVWLGDKLEAVFTALNNLHSNGTTPVNMAINFGSFFLNTTLSVAEPIISWGFAYRGSAIDAERYLAPFNAIKAAYDEAGDVPFPEISHKQQTSVDDFVCLDGNTHVTTTAGLQVYNVTAERQIFDSFKQRIASNPALAAATGILHEGYSTEAVDAHNPDDSAFPFRADHHLTLFNAIVAPGDANLEKAAWKWAKEVRDLWNAGQPGRPIHAYVNYANGYESLEERYGHEAWRLRKLRALKARYDPRNKFRYYNPIV